MVCASCHSEIPPGARFCPNCGAPVTSEAKTINTGGGAYAAGAVTAGRDFVGRDQINQGVSADDLDRLFQGVYQKIDARPPDPKVDPPELTQTVTQIKDEASKGDQARPDRIERWLNTLADLAPDILDVTTSALMSPVAGVTEAIRVIAKRVQAASGSPAPG